MRGIGGQVGADSNAITSQLDTQFTLQIPIEPKSKLEEGSADYALFSDALDFLSDWAAKLSPTPDEIEHEVNVRANPNSLKFTRPLTIPQICIEEMRQRLGIETHLVEAHQVYSRLPTLYGSRLPRGDVSALRNATPESVGQFYQKWYRPDLMRLLVVGHYKEDEETMKRMKQLIEARFGIMPDRRDTDPLLLPQVERPPVWDQPGFGHTLT